jgi:hypothetical protein
VGGLAAGAFASVVRMEEARVAGHYRPGVFRHGAGEQERAEGIDGVGQKMLGDVEELSAKFGGILLENLLPPLGGSSDDSHQCICLLIGELFHLSRGNRISGMGRTQSLFTLELFDMCADLLGGANRVLPEGGPAPTPAIS